MERPANDGNQGRAPAQTTQEVPRLMIPQHMPHRHVPNRVPVPWMSTEAWDEQERRSKEVDDENEALYLSEPAAYRLAVQLQLTSLKPLDESANSIVFYYIMFNTLVADSTHHGQPIYFETGVHLFLRRVGVFYPEFEQSMMARIRESLAANTPRITMKDIMQALNQVMVVQYGRFVDRDLGRAVNSIRPTSKRESLSRTKESDAHIDKKRKQTNEDTTAKESEPQKKQRSLTSDLPIAVPHFASTSQKTGNFRVWVPNPLSTSSKAIRVGNGTGKPSSQRQFATESTSAAMQAVDLAIMPVAPPSADTVASLIPGLQDDDHRTPRQFQLFPSLRGEMGPLASEPEISEEEFWGGDLARAPWEGTKKDCGNTESLREARERSKGKEKHRQGP